MRWQEKAVSPASPLILSPHSNAVCIQRLSDSPSVLSSWKISFTPTASNVTHTHTSGLDLSCELQTRISNCPLVISCIS